LANKPIFYFGGRFATWHIYNGFEQLLDLMPAACYSYYYKEDFEVMLPEMRERKIPAFLDSGAFSFLRAADKLGQQLSCTDANQHVKEYAAWIQAIKFPFDFVCTFDYIRDPKEVLRVTRMLERLGVPRVVPVYHAGTSITALHKLIDAGYRRICISRGMEFSRHGQTRAFLDQVFNVTEKDKIECHGLACTSIPVLLNYPWYSVDSTSWLMTAMNGFVLSLSGEERIPSSRKKAKVSARLEDDRVQRARANLKAYQAILDRIPTYQGKRTLF